MHYVTWATFAITDLDCCIAKDLLECQQHCGTGVVLTTCNNVAQAVQMCAHTEMHLCILCQRSAASPVLHGSSAHACIYVADVCSTFIGFWLQVGWVAKRGRLPICCPKAVGQAFDKADVDETPALDNAEIAKENCLAHSKKHCVGSMSCRELALVQLEEKASCILNLMLQTAMICQAH